MAIQFEGHVYPSGLLKPKPQVQNISGEDALDALKRGTCDAIHWQSTSEQVARNERMYPSNRALYVACAHPSDRLRVLSRRQG